MKSCFLVTLILICIVLVSCARSPIEKLTRSAERGDADAQLSLGFTYDHGLGVLEDDTEAYKWYRMAANKVTSMLNIV